MEALQNRINSFVKSKRVKGSRTALKWPHPPTIKANPQALAEAGFYFNPSHEDKDNVACFECGKQLSEWEENDDPFDLHWTKCGDKCSWAVVRCGLRGDMDRHGRFTFPDKTRLPGTKRMEKARLGTFSVGDGWIHDQTKGHCANSRKMAQAGFVWTPLVPGDDLATCLYCNISLSGWEEGDDPMEEHRKRVKSGTSCPFLAYSSASGTSSTITSSPTTNKLTRSTSAKPPSKAQAKPPSRSRSSRQTRGHKELVKVAENHSLEEGDDVKRIDEEVEDDISDIPTIRLVKKPAEAKRTRKSSRAPPARPSTRGITRATSQLIPDTEPTKGKSQNKAKVLTDVREEDESSDEIAHLISEEEEVERRPAPSRSRPSRKPAKTRAKSISRRKQEEVVTQDESEDLGTSRSRTRKGHKRRVIEDTDEDIPPPGRNLSEREEEEIVPVPSRSRDSKKVAGKSSSRSKKVERSTSRKKQEEVVIQDESEDLGASMRGMRKGHERQVIEDTDGEGEDIPPPGRNLSEREGEEVVPVPSRSRDSKRVVGKSSSRSKKVEQSTSQKKQEEVVIKDESEDLGASMRGMRKGHGRQVIEDTDGEGEDTPLVGHNTSEREEIAPTPSQSRAPKKPVGKPSSRSNEDKQSQSRDAIGGKGRHQTRKRIESEESGTEATREEENAAGHATSEHEEERRMPPPSRSTTKRPSRAPSANASRGKKGGNEARQRAPEKVEEETLDEDDSNCDRDGIDLPIQLDQSEPDEENLTVPPRSRASGPSAKTRGTSSRKELRVSSEDELDSVAPKPKSRVIPEDDILANENTVRLGNEEERTPMQRSRIPISEKFKPIRSPRKEAQAQDRRTPDEEMPLSEAPAKDGYQKQRTSIRKATPPPTEPLTLVSTVKTPSPSPSPARPTMTTPKSTPVTAPEPPVPPVPSSMTVKATTPEPQILPVLSRIPFMPLQMLTEAELDMTVEEWVRYHMEIEYDKLKRDGERELARFKARAEEARKRIECL